MEEKNFPLKIGLEIHGYLDTKEKLFCNCKTDFLTAKPNTLVCPICKGEQGAKPNAPNKDALKKVTQIALILGCEVNYDKELFVSRKHYEYIDCPKGYQLTISGSATLPNAQNGNFQGIRITECHLEEDPAQIIYETGEINHNRSSLPLIEIVTEPDFRSSEQVIYWLKTLVHSLSYVKALRKNGGIKVDVNISTYGERVEIKNINSLEKIKKALDYEISRQLEEHKEGKIQGRETRAFDEASGKTKKMREKEQASDYNCTQDPDLEPIIITKKEVEEIKMMIPEMPFEKIDRLIKEYNLEKFDADILVKNLELVDFAEEFAKSLDLKKNISWITIELLRILNYNKTTLDDVKIEPKHLVELVSLIEKGDLTVLKAKQIMNDFIPESFSVSEKIGDEMKSLSEEEIGSIAKKVIETNGNVVEEYRSGKKESFNFLVGQVMRNSQKRASPEKAREILLRFL